MKFIFLVLALGFLPHAFSDTDSLDFTPESYSCFDGTWGRDRKLDVSRKDGAYEVKFGAQERPGKLKDYLSAQGVDPRIISNYQDWEILTNIPEKSCKAKTFASKYPEELTCDANISFTIKAYYESAHDHEEEEQADKRKVDVYEFKNSKVKLQTKTVKLPYYKGAKPEDMLKFSLTYEFKDTTGKSHKIESSPTYRVLDEHPTEGSGLVLESECRLTALDGLVDIRLAEIIERRKKR